LAPQDVASAASFCPQVILASVTETEIREWCLECLCRMIDAPLAAIEPDATFAQMGLDSATSVYFVVELEEWLGRELEPEIVAEYPTVAQLAHHLADGGG
jgi:acyl carrier protein